ncbi:MAG: 3-hydroxyacyl-CoA dehydrogenase NAD-binding domain-containing protein [Eubacteriales bacterium]
MKKIMILGAGTMALGLAEVYFKKGFEVTVHVQTEDRIKKATDRLTAAQAVDVKKAVKRAQKKDPNADVAAIEKKSNDAFDAFLKGLKFTFDLNDAKGQDLIIEAIVERMDTKKEYFSKLEDICGPETIFATNTSSLSITEIATATKRADKFIGFHFFNPVPVMKLVELVRGMGTSDETFKAISDMCTEIDKQAVAVNETPGFVVNRLLIPIINDAANLLEAGVSDAAGIDTCMKLGANHPMGPLALGDFIGLDVCLAIMETLWSETGDARYRPSLLLKKMVRGNLLGMKTKEGFYNYNR